MNHSALRHLDRAHSSASMPGCFRKPEDNLAREADFLGPPPAPRRSARPGRAASVAVALLLLMPLSVAFGETAALKVQNATVPPDGRSLSVPVVFSAPAACAVAALQFDVEFDPAVLTLAPSGGVLEGAAAKAAGKQISFSKVSPDRIRVLVVGLNADPIAGGEVATLNFNIPRGAVSTASAVHLRNAVLADPNGSEVPVQTGGDDVQDNLSSPPGGTAEPLSAFPLAAVVVALGFLIAAGVVAGFVWRRRAPGKIPSENPQKRPATRCAAGRHG